MAAASYDQLLRQVEVLKMENSNLRQELQDNSNHLTKLETEASNMKEVLKQLQGTIEEEPREVSGSQLELIGRLKALPPLPLELQQEPPEAPQLQDRRQLPSPGGDCCLREETATINPISVLLCLSCDWLLPSHRSLLLAELEKEEKEKDWYYAQLQNLTKRIDSLPLTENTDMSRRQLEFEARQIRSAMEEQLGSCQEMERRAQVGRAHWDLTCMSGHCSGSDSPEQECVCFLGSCVSYPAD
ncbi:hypothetical protein XENOCAPTIV_022730 [Xenoophorus captivus]|uniref:Adenomatous polyposis coli N-terminal dimerisation domain-containing protein n=1 Tax=Xenoophorus captivus TaxID=1517983 RepID=A0ABV0QJL5_9TELE